MGSQDFEREVLVKRVGAIKRLLLALPLLEVPQVLFLPQDHRHLRPPDTQWAHASLPVTKGGFGLRSAVKHGSAAYLASLFASQPLVELMRGEDKEDEREEMTLPEAPELAIAPGGWLARKDDNLQANPHGRGLCGH